jgi:F-type H+-transporting ATPase subunit c
MPHMATLTDLGKGLGFGLSLGLAAFGSAIGIGLIFSSVINSSARQPEARNHLQPLMWVGLAVTEAITFFGLTRGLIVLFLICAVDVFSTPSSPRHRPVLASNAADVLRLRRSTLQAITGDERSSSLARTSSAAIVRLTSRAACEGTHSIAR